MFAGEGGIIFFSDIATGKLPMPQKHLIYAQESNFNQTQRLTKRQQTKDVRVGGVHWEEG